MTRGLGHISLRAQREDWALQTTFRIAGYSRDSASVVVVTLSKDGVQGRGEATGMRYRGETPESILAQIGSVASDVERGLSRDDLCRVLPAGGARNAIDCAMWDLEAKLEGVPVWVLASMPRPRPAPTTYTCGADEPGAMADTARGYTAARALKLKLTGDDVDVDRVRQVREARPDIWLGVDANQGFTPRSLDQLMPALVECRVSVIEQPFRIGEEYFLDRLQSPIPIIADESIREPEDVARLGDKFDIINLKLDKCGGLTTGLAMAAMIGDRSRTMVGCMAGTSLGIAPAMLLAQRCDLVDLDAPLILKHDRRPGARYRCGTVSCSSRLWGGADTRGLEEI